jgi:hypothetical protein
LKWDSVNPSEVHNKESSQEAVLNCVLGSYFL